MATLRFNFGTMGSGKSTMALQIHHNLASRQLYGLLLTKLDREGAQVTSRLGVAAEAIEVPADLDLYKLAVDHWPIHYMVCDEVQFYTVQQCDQLGRAVDDLGVDVFAFGLITDFRGELFDGTKRMLEIADELRAAGGFVVFVNTNQRLAHADMLQQHAGMPRVLARHGVHCGERGPRTFRDVAEIPDGGGNNV